MKSVESFEFPRFWGLKITGESFTLLTLSSSYPSFFLLLIMAESPHKKAKTEKEETIAPSWAPILTKNPFNINKTDINDLLTSVKDDWNLSVESIDRASTLLLADGGDTIIALLKQYKELLLFLYAKEILAEKSVVMRVLSFSELLNSEKKTPAALDGDGPFERLERLVTENEKSTQEFSEGKTAFDQFVKNHAEWTDEEVNSWVAFRDHPELKNKPHAYVERVQPLSGLCYMHGPVVLQHYMVTMATDQHHEMLDMAKFLRQHRGPRVLEDYILNDHGGDSRSLLKEILVPNSEITTVTSSSMIHQKVGTITTEHVVELLKSLGPALVSTFQVNGAFRKAETDVFTGNARTDWHARYGSGWTSQG